MSETLLPPNATKAERALEGATSRISDVPLRIRESWDPDTCPVALLPWLAWAFSVDEWDPDWPEDVKRAVIRTSYDQHRKKGTVASVRRSLRTIGYGEIVIDEGRNHIKYNGAHKYDGFPTYGHGWAEYRVWPAKLLSPEQEAVARRELDAHAPFRSQLYSFEYGLAAPIHNGLMQYDGTYKYGT